MMVRASESGKLEEVKRKPVRQSKCGTDRRHVELPAAEHAFDLWPSERTAGIAEGIGRFMTAIARGSDPVPPRPDPVAEAIE